MKLLVQKREWTLWYIVCLFWLNIFMFVLVKYVKSALQLLLSGVVMAALGILYYQNGGGPLVWNIDVCMTASLFFIAGYVYKVHNLKINSFIEGKRLTGILFVFSLAINIVCMNISRRLTGSGLEMNGSQYGSPVFTYISAFAGIAVMIILAKRWTFSPIRYIGENTMLFYAWHQTIMFPIVQRIVSLIGLNVSADSGVGYIVCYKLICVLITLGLTTACIWVIKKMRLGIILGK